MKDQEKAAPRRRQLVGRNEFPPFKRNQIRWALHCYRWKHGISWEKYPYEIAHALGMKGLGEGLNSRDPRGFVLEDQTPKPDKLRLYERFIETVAPDYAKAFTEDGLTSTLADMLGRYMNPDWEAEIQSTSPIEDSGNLESFVYFEPCPGTAGFEESNTAWISVFRRIGDTPYFKMFSVMIDDAFSAGRNINLDGVRQDPVLVRHRVSFCGLLETQFDDSLIVSEVWKGLVVPFSGGQCYLAILEEQQTKSKNIVQLCPCAVSTTHTGDNNWRTEYEYAKPSPEAPCMHSFLFRTHKASGIEPAMEETVMLGVEHEAAQNFFSTMNLRP